MDDFAPEELLDLAVRHLQEFSYVGFTETFERDRDVILGALGMPIPEAKVASNVNEGRTGLKDISRECRNLLDELTFLDRQLYEMAWSKLHDN